MPTVKATGCSANSFTALENAVIKAGGSKFDYQRTYAILDKWQDQDPLTAAQQGYQLVASIKPKDASGFTSPADITAGAIDGRLITMYDRLLSAKPPSKGKHVFAPWHESDTFIPKGGRATTAEVDSAVAHMINLFISRPAFANGRWDVSFTLTGYEFTKRIVAYPKTMAAILALGVRGILGIDSPYTNNPEQNIGPALDYITLHWPKLRVQIHECGRDDQVVNGQTRAGWFAAFAQALMTKRYDQVDAVLYWNSADVTINPALVADVAALAGFQKALVTTPKPPAPPSTPVPNTELSALTAATQRVQATAAALATAQDAHEAALENLVAASTAVVTP